MTKAYWMMLATLALPALAADKDKSEQIAADKKALQPLGGYVGNWSGSVTSKSDAAARDTSWEDVEWAWDFKGGKAALTYSSPKGKYFTSGRIEPQGSNKFKFIGQLPPDGKKTEEYTGEINKEKELELTNANPAEGRPAKMGINLRAKGDRLVINLEKKFPSGRFAPLAEIGFTRKGSGFGQAADPRECVVTGGSGKIAVTFKGQTYYVCCGGCKEAFDENPEKEIAGFKKRKEEEKAARMK